MPDPSERVKRRGLEGIIGKLRNSVYEPGAEAAHGSSLNVSTNKS
jgi:hypothetical protein